MLRPFVLSVAALLLVASGCGGGGNSGSASTPLAAAENAMLLASRGEKVAFARTLASGPRGASTADIQLEILSEWLHLRGVGALDLETAELDGWDALRLADSTSATATVATVLRFRRPSQDPPERPVPLEIDLVLESGSWRIADARMTPLPAWYRTEHAQEAFPGEPTPPIPPPPTLAQLAASYRPPPPSWKR